MKLAMLMLLFAPAVAMAAGGATSASEAQAAMVVTGTVTVNADGHVADYTLRDPGALPPVVVQLVKQTVPAWVFQPILVDGKPVVAEAGMSLRIVADVSDAKHATVQVASAEFGCEARAASQIAGECPAGTSVTYAHTSMPQYPIAAVKQQMGGEVFTVIEVGRDGHVTRAAVRQVNLSNNRMTGYDETRMRQWLAQATLAAVRDWRFNVPTVGPNAPRDHWVVQVPFAFAIGRQMSPGYGQWRAYVPGPVQNVPWSDDASGSTHGGADAIAGSVPFVRDPRFVLKTAIATGDNRS